MSLLPQIALGLAMGLVFGFALEKSRVFEPGVIVGQMQLRNFLMLKVFLAAVVTGLVVLAALNGLWGVKLHPKGLEWQSNLIGGLILGAGIVLAGACPGTTLAQIGAGYRDAWFTLAGALFGAAAYGYAESTLSGWLSGQGAASAVTYASLVGLPFWAAALIVAAILVAVLVALERMTPWEEEVGEDADGLAPRVAPTPSHGARGAHA